MARVNSSRTKISPEELEAAMQKLLKDYDKDVQEVVRKTIPQAARAGAKQLRSTSPKGKTGKYASGWASKVEQGRTGVTATIYGKHGTYQLAHLLEHGHAVRNGGRASGFAGAIVHIAPVEEWVIQEATKRTMEGVARI